MNVVHYIIIFILFIQFSFYSQLNFLNAWRNGSTLTDIFFDIDSDNSGNLYAVGYFDGTVDFDPGPGVVNLTSNGVSDVVIAKYTSAGSLLWVKQIGGPNNENGRCIKVDRISGFVYVGFNFSSVTIDVDPGPAIVNFNLISGANNDMVLLKLDLMGNFQWARQFGGVSIDFINKIETDHNGNIYTCGYFTISCNFDLPPPAGNNSNITLTSQTPTDGDAFLTKHDIGGNLLYVKSWGSVVNDYANNLIFDNLNNIVIVGQFGQGSAIPVGCDFDPGPGIYNLTTSGFDDGFILKLSATTGNFIHAIHFGSIFIDRILCITVDALNNYYVGGSFHDAVDFDPGPGTTILTSSGGPVSNPDAFVAKYDQNLNLVWAFRIGSSNGTQTVFSIKKNPGNTGFFIGGNFSGSNIDFDPGPGTWLISPTAGYDPFIASYDDNGNFICCGHIACSGSMDYLTNITFSNSSIFAVGGFFNTGDFDPGPGTFNLTSSGNLDAYIWNVSPGSCNIILPLFFSNFTSVCNEDKIVLNWNFNYSNECKIIVQKSKDGVAWSDIEIISLTSTKSDISYTLTAENVNYYYRLKLFADKSSQDEITSNPIMPNCPKSVPIRIFPNPVENELNILCPGKSNIEADIFQTDGKKIYSFSHIFEKSNPNDNNLISVPLKDITSGIYILKIYYEYKEYNFKLIIK